jgi:hypothetical protein
VRPQQRDEQVEKLLSVAALAIALELVLFKFLPDISTAVLQHSTSTLTDFAAFERYYLRPGSVHHARFLGNYTLYYLAEALGHVVHSADPRLHPLRVAAAILTPVYAYLGVHLVLAKPGRMDWRKFFVPYAFAVLIGQYVFYPADMPALAFLSTAVYLLLSGQLLPALLLMLLTGLFRESALHMVWFVAAWVMCDRSVPVIQRLGWLGAFALSFVLEYGLIRHIFMAPVSAAGTIVVDPRALFLDKGLLSLTTVCSLALAALFPLACALRVRSLPRDDWRRAFFLLNCWVFPGWILFYRMMSGNIAEFRLLLPVVLPCIYGIAYARRPTTVIAPAVH